MLSANLWTPERTWCGVLEYLMHADSAKKFLTFCGFFNMFARARHLSLPRARWNQFTSPHLLIALPSYYSVSPSLDLNVFVTKRLYAFLIFCLLHSVPIIFDILIPVCLWSLYVALTVAAIHIGKFNYICRCSILNRMQFWKWQWRYSRNFHRLYRVTCTSP